MCLGQVTEQFDPPEKSKHSAFKIFMVDYKGRLTSPYPDRVGGIIFPTGEWFNDPLDKPIRVNRDLYYRTGFHLYLNFNEAQNMRNLLTTMPSWAFDTLVVKQVKYDYVVARGTERWLDVVVARRIRIQERCV